ncbi:MAG TPA: HAMP domain-containing sensor histidine kinase [Roseiarcus sp.]|nr:HAMP domain-containing sensor histidine kinase [Roseiarcus sp.]
MRVVRRRLFWKVYLTLLASLVAVAVLIGTFWGLVGENMRGRWGALRLHLADQMLPERDNPPGAIAAAIRRLAEESGADVSVYDAQGTLIASSGEPIALIEGEGHHLPVRPPVLRVDLADGRALLARLKGPAPNLKLRILSVVLIVAGGVALAAFPITARLTRRLEGLRAGVERWGAGAHALRVDEAGDDEVAIVARTFNAAAARVEELLTSQKALLANASHELRSPLARLRIAIELWSREPSLEMQAEIVRNLSEIDHLVEEILLASRLDHARASVAPAARVDLLGLAAEEGARFQARVAAMPEGAGPVEIDGEATLLRRLIRNLLENAAKHGAPPVEVAVTRDKDKARIVVCDHGPGIAPADRERVFEPFYRPSGRSESSGGWGLGLSLVRQIAERHGGAAFCDAEPGGGSRFVVELAMRKEGAAGVAAE